LSAASVNSRARANKPERMERGEIRFLTAHCKIETPLRAAPFVHSAEGMKIIIMCRLQRVVVEKENIFYFE
jgi:hypothetical protein